MDLRELFARIARRGYFYLLSDPNVPFARMQELINDPDFVSLLDLAGRQYHRPMIVCLCGSTRFYDAWQQANFDLTVAGNIVLSVGFYPHAADEAHAAHVGITPEQKTQLDELHKRKIDLADEILVLNVGGYIGESTRSEIQYARTAGKTIRYLEALK